MNSITVITPVLNGQQFILDCLRSVRNQSLKAHHIVVDGGSTDNTLEVINNFGGITVINAPGSNIYEALNIGISAAITEIVAFLNCDDYYSDDHILESVLSSFRSSPDCRLVYGDCAFVDNHGSCLYIQKPPKNLTYSQAKRSLYIVSHPACFFKTSLFREYGLYDTSIRLASDCEFIIRLLHKKERMKYIPLVLSFFRLHGGNSSKLNSAHNDWIIISKKYNFKYFKYVHYFFLIFYNMKNYHYLWYRFKKVFQFK